MQVPFGVLCRGVCVCVCACIHFCARLSSQFTLVLLSPVTPTHPFSYLHPEDCPLFNIWAWFHVVNEGCNAIIARPKSHADWNRMHIASYNPSRPAIYSFVCGDCFGFITGGKTLVQETKNGCNMGKGRQERTSLPCRKRPVLVLRYFL